MKELRACPKPERPARDPAYVAEVRRLGCIICGSTVEIEVHHAIEGRFAQRKASDHDTICLCGAHHRLKHRSPATFLELYGFEADLVASTRAAVERVRRSLIGGRS